jgi:hypothetical protein
MYWKWWVDFRPAGTWLVEYWTSRNVYRRFDGLVGIQQNVNAPITLDESHDFSQWKEREKNLPNCTDATQLVRQQRSRQKAQKQIRLISLSQTEGRSINVLYILKTDKYGSARRDKRAELFSTESAHKFDIGRR